MSGNVMDGHYCGRGGEMMRGQMEDGWMSAPLGHWVGQWKAR
jgi:hypothetical protein